MGFEDSIVAIYKADTGVGGVNTLLSGGIYTFAYIDRLGINYDNTPAVFASGGLYNPFCVVHSRDENPDGGIRSDSAQVTSYRVVLETYVYADGSAGYSVIDSVLARIVTLLNGKRVDSCLTRWVYNMKRKRAPEYRNACMERTDYEIRGLKTP